MEHDMQSSTAFCMSLLIESVCRIATSISSTRRGSVRGLVLVYRSGARSTTDPFRRAVASSNDLPSLLLFTTHGVRLIPASATVADEPVRSRGRPILGRSRPDIGSCRQPWTMDAEHVTASILARPATRQVRTRVSTRPFPCSRPLVGTVTGQRLPPRVGPRSGWTTWSGKPKPGRPSRTTPQAPGRDGQRCCTPPARPLKGVKTCPVIGHS